MTASTDASLAHAIRFLAIDAIVRAGEGRQGVPLGMAEIATELFTRHLKGLPVKFVFSHNSIGIGRNGPTHQPVEILA